MGKASKWFRGLLGRKKPDPSTTSNKPPQHKRWSLLKSFRDNKEPVKKSGCAPAPGNDADHSIAVATSTAKLVEASSSVVSAKAAAAVVKLTNNTRRAVTSTTTTTSTASTAADGGAEKSDGMTSVSKTGAGYESREEWAAVKIQSHFRAYLSRRALRALKALVRLQALVRGSIQRKENASKLQRLEQVFLKAQARARAGRPQTVDSSLKSNPHSYPGPLTPEKFEPVRARSTRRGENMSFWGNSSRSNGNHKNSIDVRSWEQQGESSSTRTTAGDHERCERILEIEDDSRFHVIPRPRNLFHSSHLSFGSDQCSHVILSPPTRELHTISPMKYYGQDADEEHCYYTASSKRQAGNKVGAFTPTKSDGSVSCLSGYSDNPNYMSFTESSKAKMRSLSAPKQRPQQYERSSSTKRCLLQGYVEPRLNNQRVMQSSFFASKAYPGSGRLDRLGMPVHEEGIGFSGGHWNLY